jgi:predicted MFS family arabinose efflux permease
MPTQTTVSATRRLLFLACAVLLVEAFFSQVLTPLVPGYRRDLGLSEGATGLLVASYSAGALLLALAFGYSLLTAPGPRSAATLGHWLVPVLSAAFSGPGLLGGFADSSMRANVLDRWSAHDRG